MEKKETKAHFMEQMDNYIKKRKFVEKHGKILLKEAYVNGMDEYKYLDVLFSDGHYISIKKISSDTIRVQYSKNYTQSTVKRLVKAKTFDILRFVNVIKINKT